MQCQTSIQPKRPTTRIRRSDPTVLAMRAQLESMPYASFLRLAEQLRDFEETGIQGDDLKSFLGEHAAIGMPIEIPLAA